MEDMSSTCNVTQLNALHMGLILPHSSFRLYLDCDNTTLLALDSRVLCAALLNARRIGGLLDRLIPIRATQMGNVARLRLLLRATASPQLCGHQLALVPILQTATQRLHRGLQVLNTALLKCIVDLKRVLVTLLLYVPVAKQVAERVQRILDAVEPCKSVHNPESTSSAPGPYKRRRVS